jgi:ABC-2 type transport system permease protein
MAAPAARGLHGRSLAVQYRLILRLQLTPLRVVGLLSLGLLSALLGVLVRGADDPAEATAQVVVGYGLGLAVPLACAWMATSAVGDLVEDRLLVYLWLKPVPRWHLPVAATAATVTVVVPLIALPLAATPVVAGTSDLAGTTLVASLFAVTAYAGIFVAAGLWFRRALWWALLYILVWENGLARAVDGAARLSIASYAQSLVTHAAGVDIAYADRARLASVLVPVLVCAAGLVLAVVRYRRAEVD